MSGLRQPVRHSLGDGGGDGGPGGRSGFDADGFAALIEQLRLRAEDAGRATVSTPGKQRQAAGRHARLRVLPLLAGACAGRLDRAALLDALVAAALEANAIRPVDAAAWRADAALKLFPSRGIEGL
jgi:GTPase involved in cell partitioning and DNA repair